MTQLMYINPTMKITRTVKDGNGGDIIIENKIREQEIAKLKALKEQGYIIIGLEMTVESLAEFCDRNIDPQHTEGRADQSCTKEIAEKAPELLGWFKGKDLDKIIFITNRVDVDAIGAYVLADRYLKGEKISLNENVAAIDAHDTHLGAKWEGPKPIEQAFDTESKTGALASSIKVFMVTPKNIEDVKNFIDTGNVDEVIMDNYKKSQQGIIDKVKSGEIKTEVICGVAYVETTLPCATNVGYSLAPIVVAKNPVMRGMVESINPEVLEKARGMSLTPEERTSFATYERIAKEMNMPATVQETYTYCKISICQHEAGYADLGTVKNELSARETGWGGSPTFIGSPQGQDCTTEISDIKKLVYANLTAEYKSQVISQEYEKQKAVAKTLGLPSDVRVWHRVGGSTECGDAWVIQADGTFREPTDFEPVKRYGDGYKSWEQIFEGEVVLSWAKEYTAAEHQFEVIYMPEKGLTAAQKEVILRIEEEIPEQWKDRRGLTSKRPSPDVGMGWNICGRKVPLRSGECETVDIQNDYGTQKVESPVIEDDTPDRPITKDDLRRLSDYYNNGRL